MNHKVYFKLIEYPGGWKDTAADWLHLFKRCDRPCMFYHPLFIEAAQVLPANIAPTHVVLGYQDNVLVFGVPIRLESYWSFLTKISFFSGPFFAHLAPLDSTPGWTASKGFFTDIKSRYPQAIIQGDHLEDGYTKFLLQDIGPEKQFKVFSRPSWRCLYLSLPKNPEDLLNNLSGKFRYNIRSSLKKAENAGIEFRILTRARQGYDFVNAFDNLMRIYEARSKSVNRVDNFVGSGLDQYYKTICKLGEKSDDTLMFAEALHQGEVIASDFGFFTRNAHYGQIQGFLPEYGKFSIGTLLMYQKMLALIEREVPIFDFLMGTVSYKHSWTQKVDKNFNVLLSTTSFRSRAAFEWLCLQQSRERQGGLSWLKYRLTGRS